ncbi:MAG: RidA family protein, partial [Aurantibacter sp.]
QDIEIQGDNALLHKKFFGAMKKKDGGEVPTDWQTLYRCRKIDGAWKIVGFTGYMPLLQKNINTMDKVGKKLPQNADQHETAGPYSPVLEVNPGRLVVISGQAAIDKKGKVIGNTIEEQTKYTLDNCAQQLATASCSLQDVFKVNVFIKDLNEWPRFNTVYEQYFQDPKPVRTAVESGLLMTLLVEVEMWAVKN